MPVGAAVIVALKILPKGRAAPAGATPFDLPGALTVIGGLTALMFGLASTEAHGWLPARTLTALSLSAVLLAAFAIIERRTRRPLVAPHTWKVVTLVAGTTVMLGVTAILAGTVFLTSIFFQAVLGFSPLLAVVAFLPLALAITAGTHLASKLMARTSPRTIAVAVAVAAAGLTLAATGAGLLSTAPGPAHYAPDLLPGLLVLELGVGMVFVAVSETAMKGIPPQHAGTASGFLMTGHEVGAALGVAVLSAVATTAGNLTSPAAVFAGFSRGFVVVAVLVAITALLKMPSTRSTSSGHMH